MRVAFCLYGQARRYLEGYRQIDDFVKRNPDVSFDFFYHMWFDPAKEMYDCSTYRNISEKELHINSQMVDRVYELYKPKCHKVEKPIVFDTVFMESLPIYMRSSEILCDNIQNTLCQLYSKQKVRDILKSHCRQENPYALVIASRFDFCRRINIDLKMIDTSKLYVNNIHSPRYLLNDNYLICNPDIFYILFNLFDELPSILIDQSLQNKLINLYNEPLTLSPENILFAMVAKYYDVKSLVIYTDKIPNFI